VSQPAAPLRRRRPLLVLVLVACFIGIPIIEIWLLGQVSHAIGLEPTIGILILEAILGGWLMQREGARSWRALQGALEQGRMPGGHLADAALVLVGGILLMLPGFFTDVVGVLFLLPATRPAVRKFLSFVLAKQAGRLGARVPKGDAGVTVIRGETVEDSPTDSVRPDQGRELRP